MKDYLVRGMSMDGFVKVVAICSTEIVRRGAQIHGTTPNATAAFGRTLTAASMMGNMQKVDNGSMTLQIKGGGPLEVLFAFLMRWEMSEAMWLSLKCLWWKSDPASWMLEKQWELTVH